MNNYNDWNEEEDNFNMALSQRTEELYRVPTMEPDADGLIKALVLPVHLVDQFTSQRLID